MLPNLNENVKGPALLSEAVKRGVKVIAAHCGTKSAPFEEDYVEEFVRMARDHEHFYGDTAALNLPTRSHVYTPLFKHPEVMKKVMHGSDWPVIPIPPVTRLGLGATADLLHEKNWLRRDVLIKERLGFGREYWELAGKVLRTPKDP